MSFEGENQNSELPPRRKREYSEFFSNYSDDANDNDQDFNDFPESSESSDDDFFQETPRKRKQNSTSREQRARNSKAVKFVSKKRKTGSDDDDSDDLDFVAKFSGNSYSTITSQRKRKIKQDGDFVSSLSIEDLAKSEEISEDEVKKMLEEKKKPQVDEILGIIPNEPPNEDSYFVKFQREPIAHAVYLSESELLDHPSGKSHLTEFKRRLDESGLQDSTDMPGLKILGDIDEADKPPIDRIVGYNEEKQLYLVKWEGKPYEYASWVHEIKDEKQLKLYRQRNTSSKNVMMSLSKISKPYGDGPNCIPLPTYKNGNQLRPYQIEALNWLRASYHTKRNAILADEMGLGKTVMCIALLNDIVQNCGVDGPFLIVAPLSTLPNWIREFKNWSNIDTILFHGSQQDRELIAEYELFYKPPRQNIPKFQVLLTNIETVQKSIDLIQSIKWHFVIIDEAHKLKNLQSKIYQMMFSLQMEHVLLMTGTPIQNNTDEIFALMHFIAPIEFPSLEEFRKQHPSISTIEDITKLQEVIKPYMLRRKKSDVEASIGIKEETIVEVELTRSQKFYYRLLIDKKSHELSVHKSHALAQDMNNLAMQLRKVCNHPYLFEGVEDEIKKPGEDPCEAMINASGKLVFIDKLLAKLKPKGNKILIFSQMVQILNILEDFLNYRDYSYVRLDGSIVGEVRQEAIDRFSDPNSDVFVFLLCTRAGGVGLNLTAADTVIIYDSDWNPQNDLQAQARCHRIGQTKDVKVYRLITRGTYEQDMFLRASIKLGLDQAILDSGTISSNEMTPKEIETLIKRGAYHVFNDDETAADEFVAEDVDQILEKHTTTLTKSVADNDSVFSKAQFIVDKNGEQIDLNDKNFWDKVIPENLRHHTEAEDQPLPPRRSRSMTSYNETELEKATKKPEFSWNVKTRDVLLKALLSLGYGRWEDIHARTHLKTDLQKIIDGCNVLLFLISKNIAEPSDFLAEILGTDQFVLTKPQKKVKQSSAFNNQNFLSILSQDAEEHATRLKQLHAIIDWHQNGEKMIAFNLDEEAPNGWSNKWDKKLLKQVYQFGWGNWKQILKDETWAQFQTSDLNDRLIFIADSLIARLNGDECDDETMVIPDLKPAEIRTLVNLLTYVGIPKDTKDDSWIIYANFFSGVDEYQLLIRKLIECIRVIAYFDPNGQQNALRRWLNSICPHADVLASQITQQQAIHIKNNINFIIRLRNYQEKYLSSLSPVEEPSNTFVPECWIPGKNDIQLINHICNTQFGKLCSFPLTQMKDQLSEQEIKQLQNIDAYFEKHTQFKRVKSDLSFFTDEYAIIDRIEDFIEQNGGWKDIPRIIDLPQGQIGIFNLPFTEGDVVIESTGEGEFFCYNGYLVREGLSTFVRYGKTRYQCLVAGKEKFIVKRGEKHVYEGDSPESAWHQADEEFEMNAESMFGITCNQVIALFDKLCSEEKRKELGLLDYIPPQIITFPSINLTKR